MAGAGGVDTRGAEAEVEEGYKRISEEMGRLGGGRGSRWGDGSGRVSGRVCVGGMGCIYYRGGGGVCVVVEPFCFALFGVHGAVLLRGYLLRRWFYNGICFFSISLAREKIIIVRFILPD